MVAQSIDIEVAKYDGQISDAGTASFTDTRVFHTASDDYSLPLFYINSQSANGTDASGNTVMGFKYWNFAYPTLLTSGSGVNTSFMDAVNDSVNFGGAVGPVPAYGTNFMTWNDMANPNGWAASATVLMPSLLPLGFVQSGLVNGAFSMSVIGGATAATVDVSSASGSATLVYQVDRTNGVLTITSIDITNDLATVTSALVSGTPVKVYGLPQSDGSLKAYVLAYFTGDTMPAQ
jgi:hypothetical protein